MLGLYFTHLPRSPQCTDLHKVLHRGRLADVITCFKFCFHQFRGFRIVRCRILPFSIDLESVAINTIMAALPRACDYAFHAVNSYHRLNGSSSPVLTATSLSYGKAKNSIPHRIKTPDPIEIKFGKVDYVGEGTRRAKFYANPFKGAFRQMGEIYAKKFYLSRPMPFSSTLPQVRPFSEIFTLNICQTTQFYTRKCLFGVRKLKFNI